MISELEDICIICFKKIDDARTDNRIKTEVTLFEYEKVVKIKIIG